MPAMTPEAIERDRARRADRRKAREAEPAWRERHGKRTRPPSIAAKLKREAARLERQERKDRAPFIGCDGEGVKTPDGRSHYALFRMGGRELFHSDSRRLASPELLSFILQEPNAEAELSAFWFDYDASNILYDVPRARVNDKQPSRLERLLAIDPRSASGASVADVKGSAFAWTWLNFDGWPQFGVKYLPGNYLKVCAAETIEFEAFGRTYRKVLPQAGSERAIYDAARNFQCSFLKALNDWNIGAEHWAGIKRMKDARETFAGITPEVRDYCAIECELHAELMTAFRAQSLAAGIRQKTWNGAGKAAAALLNAWGAVKAKDLPALVPADVLKLANAAYYGGRFEVTRVGRLPRVYEHDINSAYPTAMLALPCLVHGAWLKASGPELKAQGDDAIFVCPVRFHHPRDQFLCGLPLRVKDGRLVWQRNGNGVYWSCEIKSAERLGAEIEYRAGWLYERGCDCRPFAKVSDKYAERLAAGKGTRGLPIKFALNALTGKLAERKGKSPPFQNPIWAGLVTATTRATLNDAIAATDPRNVVMLATDGIYTVKKPIKLKKGDKLGQWEVKSYPTLFIVRPGLYWPPKPRTGKWRLKSRGLSPKFFEPRYTAFQKAWRAYLKSGAIGSPPVVEVPIETFIGLRLAYRLKRPELACQWVKRDSQEFPPIRCRFDWYAKREGSARDGESLILGSKAGSSADQSLVYTSGALMPWTEPMDEEHLWFEAQPEYVDLSAPFTD